MTVLLIVFALIAAIWILAYYRLPALAWTVVIALGLAFLTYWASWPQWLLVTVWVVFIVAALLDNRVALIDPLAMYLLYARIGQSVTHLVSTSVVAINVRFAFFLAQVAIYAIWVVKLLG